MRTLLQDLRFALRIFRKNPGATAVAVLSLAVAIGPNSTLFSIVDRVVLTPATPHLSEVHNVNLRGPKAWVSFSYPDYLDFRERASGSVDLVAYNRPVGVLSWEGSQELILTNHVSGNFFRALSVNGARGRTLTADDTQPGRPPVAVISHSLWRRRFGSDPNIVGKDIRLDARAVTVVGVTPPDFRGMEPLIPTDAWLPLGALDGGARAALNDRGARFVNVFARLRPGSQPSAVEAELSRIANQLADAYPATNKARAVRLESQRGRQTGRAILSLIVLSLTGVVLLMACANVTGVLMAQAEERRRETAVRLALGAGRGRLMRQLLTESLTLSLAAAALGLLFAFWLLRFIPALQLPLPFTLDYSIRLDWRVVAYTLALSVGTAAVFGLAPSLQASRPDLVTALKGDQPGRRRRWFSFRDSLVIAQIAVCQFLLIGAGLLVRSYTEMQQIRLGFDRGKNLVLILAAPNPESGAGVRIDYEGLLDRLAALPGVKQATFSNTLVLSGSGESKLQVSVPGRETKEGDEIAARWNAIGPGFLSTMGTRLLRGRDLRRGEEKAVIVNQTLARRCWGEADPIGLYLEAGGVTRQIVGVVEDGKYGSLFEAPTPYLLIPAPPVQGGGIELIVETRGDAKSMAATIRREIVAADPRVWVAHTVTLREHLRFAFLIPQTAASFVSVIGFLGILLASVGLYGVVAYAASRRTHEIGVRMAMGARPRDVFRLILGQGSRLVLIGAGIGLAAAFALGGILSRTLYHVSGADPAAYLAAVLAVAAIALAAMYTPARRATRVDPVTVLRRE